MGVLVGVVNLKLGYITPHTLGFCRGHDKDCFAQKDIVFINITKFLPISILLTLPEGKGRNCTFRLPCNSFLNVL